MNESQASTAQPDDYCEGVKLVCVLFNWVGVLTAGDGWSHLVPVCGLGVRRFLDHGTQGFPPSTDGHVQLSSTNCRGIPSLPCSLCVHGSHRKLLLSTSHGDRAFETRCPSRTGAE